MIIFLEKSFNFLYEHLLTCSAYQLLELKKLCQISKEIEKSVASVNDAYVMNAWGLLKVLKRKINFDREVRFTLRKWECWCTKIRKVWGRSWRYAAIVENKSVSRWFRENFGSGY